MRFIALLLSALTAGAMAVSAPAPAGKTEGVPTAPVMMEVYSDFQCPSCKSFHDQNLLALRDDYISKGKLYLVYREFPLPMHAYGRQAASYACAAARVGKYPEVANALFAKQAKWSADGKVDEAACSVLSPALAQKVRALTKDPGVEAEIQRDVQLGQAAGVNSTPTMIITHKMKRYPVSGSLNYNLLRRLLDDLLAR
jgi:protein-disulfide isomerase